MKENLTLFLIDDDADDRSIFSDAVKEVDHSIHCVTAGDCMQALKYLRDERNQLPDYIFLDLRMPGYNGRRCMQEINADPRLCDIPIIIYTTSTDEEDAEELMNMGAVHFVSKPTDPTEIYYMISQVINEDWNTK
jgi:CheY-like chemotaxis protein